MTLVGNEHGKVQLISILCSNLEAQNEGLGLKLHMISDRRRGCHGPSGHLGVLPALMAARNRDPAALEASLERMYANRSLNRGQGW